MPDIAILCPTINRSESLAAMVENIRETTEISHRVYLVMESSDRASITAAETLDTIDVIGTFGSCAVAMNAGYRASTEPFVFFGNDDLLYHHNWDLEALARFSESTHVVGLNDGSGDCKCFPMARRSFIAEHSGVYDKSDTPWHTYRHLCADTEFAYYAQLRGVWANAPAAVTEHRHWRFGKADPDHPNYVRGRETNADDLAEYNRRRDQWDPEHLTPDCAPYKQ